MLNLKGRTLACLLALCGTVAPVQAQNRLSIAADLGLTAGEGRGGDYYGRTLQGIRFAASARFGAKHAALFVEGARESLASLFGEKPSCPLSPNGGCAPGYPFMDGWSTS